MAVVQYKSGDLPSTIGGTFDVFGDTSAQNITILDNSSITFRSGFNSGATDNITVTGLAQNFVISQNLGNVTLTSQIDGITLLIPVGTNGMNITFENGDTRHLDLNGNTVTLGAQVVTGTPTAVTPGIGSYTVEANAPQQVEGTDYFFTVTRTDTSIANEQLTFNIQGSTVNGSVAAATPGADFTAAGNTVTFVGNATTATFKVALNLDNDVEGLEGILAQVFKAGNVVASTTGLIEDANKVGQTFTLTPGIDTVGSGAQTDVVGSEGSTNTDGNDTIIVTENTATNFDDIDGGKGRDLIQIFDAGSGGFGGEPDFTNITVEDVEDAQYVSVRGLSGGELDTSSWTGLETFQGQIDSGLDQTFVFSTEMTSIALTNTDDGDIDVEGGSGVLTVNADNDTSADVNVGQDGSANAFTSIFVNNGNDIAISDNSGNAPVSANPLTLTSVLLNGFIDDATIAAGNLQTLGITNLSGAANRSVSITGAANPTVNLSSIALTGTLSLTAQNSAQWVVGNGVTTGLVDFNSHGTSSLTLTGANQLNFDDFNTDDGAFAGPVVAATVTNNSSNGSAIVFDDINGDTAGGNDLRTVNLNANSGAITFDDIFGTTPFGNAVAVNIAGSNAVQFDDLVLSGSAVITRTGSGSTNITTQLDNTTQFVGSADTGADTLIFGANQTANTLGGGNDYVTFNSGVMGFNGVTFGSIDAGAGADTFQIDQDDAVTLTAQGNFLSNFETAFLTGGGAAGQTQVVNSANLGFSSNPHYVISQGASTTATAEVTTVTFSGTATGKTQGDATSVNRADTVTFDGVAVVLDDNATATQVATDFATSYNLAGTGNYIAVDNGNGTVTFTDKTPGTQADITAAQFVFTDKQNIGAPAVDNVTINTQGVNAVAATTETATLTLTDVTVLDGQTVTVSAGGVTTTWTNTTGGAVTQNGGALADFIVAAVNGDPANPLNAVRSGNNVNFTADTAGALSPNTSVGGTGLGAGDVYSVTTTNEGANAVAAETESFSVDFVVAGNANDVIVFDGQTVTLTGTEDTNEEVAFKFVTDYNANSDGGAAPTWTAAINPFDNSQVDFTSNTAGARTDVTKASFVITDDTNVGTPGVSVAAPSTGGDVGGLVLNNFSNAGTLEIRGNGLYTVNLAANTAADSLTLFLNSGGNLTNTVTAPSVELVSINTDSSGGNKDTLTLVDSAVTTLTITGSDSLVLDTNSTAIRTVNAGALGGTLTWQADAGTAPTTAAPLTVTTGSGGSNVNVGTITVGGLAPIVFNGGTGSDFVQLGGTGTARANITLGTGSSSGQQDYVRVGLADGGNDYSSILDFENSGSSGDNLDFDGSVTVDYATGVRTIAGDTDAGEFVATRDQVLEPTAIFQDYLDQAAAGNATGDIHWFVFGNDTFVVKDNSALAEFEDGVDQIIRLANFTGQLTSANFA